MFYEEIETLEKVNIDNKLEILYIYTEIYNDMISAFNFNSKNFLETFYNHELLEGFKRYLKEMFISRIWSQLFEKLDLKDFFYKYLRGIRKEFNNTTAQKFLPVREVLKNYESIELSSKFLDKYSQNRMEHLIEILNKIDTDFNKKAYIMLYLKDYFKHLIETYNIIYKTFPDRELKINNFIWHIIDSLPEIIKISNNHEEFQHNLKRKTYSLIENQYNAETDNIAGNAYNTFDNFALKSFIIATDLNTYQDYYPQIIFEYLSGHIEEKSIKRGFSRRKVKKVKQRLEKEGLNNNI